MDTGVIWQAITQPLGYVLEPERRLFWLFMISALILASIAVTVQNRRFHLGSQLRALTNPRYWLCPSSLVDISLLFLNSGIRVLLIVPLLGSHLAATILVGSTLQTTIGDAPDIPLSLFTVGLLFTLLFFVAEDVSRFGLHWLMHKVPLLWQFHKLHHSATTLTPITVHRVHPLEMTLYYLRGLLVFGLISGVFVYLFRGKVHGWEILGVDCIGFLFNLFGANLRHTPIWLSFGRLEALFISPVQHQLHHSSHPAHADKNFGTCLALWDRLAGSHLKSGEYRKLYFGLCQEENQTREGADILPLPASPRAGNTG